jgi:hypothetical protein
MMTPTARTLKHFRDLGMTAQVTEKWNQWAHVRQDLFGFIDIVAMKERYLVGIQATSKSNMSARVKKILALDTAKTWLLAGAVILVVGWAKKKGSRSWEPTIREVTLQDFRDLLGGLQPAVKSEQSTSGGDDNRSRLVEQPTGQ